MLSAVRLGDIQHGCQFRSCALELWGARERSYHRQLGGCGCLNFQASTVLTIAKALSTHPWP